MLVVETIAKIRRAHFIQGKSIKQICRELRVSRNTVRKVIRSGATEFSYDRNEERVRGYFIKNKNFFLNENVATTIAQIACHNNSLPQGSPSSPVISNLLAHLLDMRISRIAKKARCSYTRYADDLTFSCSKKTFPGGHCCAESGRRKNLASIRQTSTYNFLIWVQDQPIEDSDAGHSRIIFLAGRYLRGTTWWWPHKH